MKKGQVINKSNLRKLAKYLLSLPENYKSFDMSLWLRNKRRNRWGEYTEFAPNEITKRLNDEGEYTCGTAGCAVGHAPLAGIPPKLGEDWTDYCDRTLVRWLADFTDEWQWCFGSEWASVDNTPQGAGKRIMYMLKHGVPVDWQDQMDGDAPLCY